MTDKLSKKRLAAELDRLKKELIEFERLIEERLEKKVLPMVSKAVDIAEKALAKRHEKRGDGTREQMIREAAYHRAAQRGFTGGSPEQDWMEAEKEVDALLAKREKAARKGKGKS